MTERMRDRAARTPLHDWHASHGARLVEFAGYELPVQYATGIIKEHLATRRQAGVFDICHMGRFRVRGEHAATFLARVLTSHVEALTPGESQYAIIATPTGGAVDDVYLYMLAADDYLLVVNAANRAKDWAWLEQHLPGAVSLEDESRALGMIALQGPRSERILRALTDGGLPSPRRNAVARCTVLARETMVARTGYTGERICFELFPEAGATNELWRALVDGGATPVGLGARDSLRLEAGLPLYGHELGTDRAGLEIPVFANALARFAVRPPGSGDYVGRDALDAQRAELDRLRDASTRDGFEPKLLPRRVEPIAVPEGRRPLRAGNTVLASGHPVGDVTSAAMVPVRAGDDDYVLRPIALALVDSRLRYRSAPPIDLEVQDERGRCTRARLVARHLELTPSTRS